jgi:ribonuclease HII
MGYSVPEHCAALVRLGPTIHHRRTFAPVAARYDTLDAHPQEILPALLLPDPRA